MMQSDWPPVGRFPDLEREIEEAFGALIDEPWGRTARSEWIPAVDIEETPDAYRISMDLPGVSVDDIHLEVKVHQIEIRGRRSAARSTLSGRRIHTERCIGRFRRTFPLPHPVDPRTATGRYEDGVYLVYVKKSAPPEEH